MGLQSAVFPLHPQLLQIERQCEKKQLCPHLCLSSGQKSAESEIGFQQAKCTLNLDGSAQPQINALLCGNVSERIVPQFLKRPVYPQHLGLLRILCLAALRSEGASPAILTPVPGGRYSVSVP